MSNTWEQTRGYYPGDWVRPRPNGGGWQPLIDLNEGFPGPSSTILMVLLMMNLPIVEIPLPMMIAILVLMS